MSLSRKMLKGMGLTEEQIDTIIEGHTETVDSLREQANTYKADSEALGEAQKELAQVKAELETEKTGGWKDKYEQVKKEYDDFKAEQEQQRARETKESAYKALLTEAGISEKRLSTVIRCSDSEINALSLDKDGKPKDSAKLIEKIKTEWSDFIPADTTNGAHADEPPIRDESGKAAYDAMSLADKMKYANQHPQEVAEWLKK